MNKNTIHIDIAIIIRSLRNWYGGTLNAQQEVLKALQSQEHYWLVAERLAKPTLPELEKRKAAVRQAWADLLPFVLANAEK